MKHLADQKRHNCAYSGQSRGKAYELDIAYYSSCDIFASANVTKRQLRGKDGIYDKIYGHAAALRSQLCEVGKDRTQTQLNLKIMGISATSLSKCSNYGSSGSKVPILPDSTTVHYPPYTTVCCIVVATYSLHVEVNPIF